MSLSKFVSHLLSLSSFSSYNSIFSVPLNHNFSWRFIIWKTVSFRKYPPSRKDGWYLIWNQPQVCSGSQGTRCMDHSLDRVRTSKDYFSSTSPLPSSSLQKSKIPIRKLSSSIGAGFRIRRITYERGVGGIRGSDAGRIPPFVHQWTRSFVRNNIAVIATISGSDSITTAHPRRRISGARAPSGRPATWAAIMGEFLRF